MAYVRSQRPLTERSQPLVARRGQKFRAALLGSAALGFVLANGSGFGFINPVAAEAALPSTAATPSFADVVDHVRGAVVSVKVKTTEVAENEESEIPRIVPGDTLERFFKRFGEEGGRRPKPHVTQAQGSGFIISPTAMWLPTTMSLKTRPRSP